MELLDEILSKENLNKAYLQVYRNKGASGIDGVTVDELKQYLKENKEEILTKIRQRKYKPQPVRRVKIPKENGKMRNLGIPTVVDRVIQQAIVQVLSPIYEKQFSESSYGFRPKRSCEMAIIRSLEVMNDGYDWIVDLDLEKFFDTVNQDKLIGLIMKTVKDGDVVSLIRKFLVSGVMENGHYEPTKVGTPQGGNLSPLLSISGVLENVVYEELLRRGYKVYIGKQGVAEVDFVAENKEDRIYIQVCYILHEGDIEREFAPLEAIQDNYEKIVISADSLMKINRNGIKQKNIIDFLLSK